MSQGTLKIGVNAGVLDGHPTGIGNFTKNIIQHLSMLTNDLRVWVTDHRFIQRSNIVTSEFLTFMPPRMRGTSIVRSVWDQLVFPCTARAAGIDVVFFPIQEGMLFPSVPQVVFVHDLGPLLFPDGVPVLRRFSYHTRIPLALKRSAAVAVPTETVRRELLCLYPFVDASNSAFAAVRFQIYRCMFDITAMLDLIGRKDATLELAGKMLIDPTVQYTPGNARSVLMNIIKA